MQHKCGAPGMCGHRRDCPDKHCPGRNMEPPDLMHDKPLLAGLGVLVWLCVAGLVLAAWRMFG